MTCFNAAANRAEPLTVARLERCAALFTMHCRSMAYAGMITGYRAWAAVGRASRRLRATVSTMLGVLAGRAKLAPVFFLVARYAKGYPVVYIKHHFWIVCDWLYMMGLNVTASTAPLASEVVTAIDGKTPFCKITFGRSPFPSQRCSTLPCCCVLPCLVFSRATSGAVDRGLVFRGERLVAWWALTGGCWVASCPARFRAVFGRFLTVCLDKKFRTADGADFDNLGVFHRDIIPHNTQNEKCYVALQRWHVMTDKRPICWTVHHDQAR